MFIHYRGLMLYRISTERGRLVANNRFENLDNLYLFGLSRRGRIRYFLVMAGRSSDRSARRTTLWPDVRRSQQNGRKASRISLEVSAYLDSRLRLIGTCRSNLKGMQLESVAAIRAAFGPRHDERT